MFRQGGGMGQAGSFLSSKGGMHAGTPSRPYIKPAGKMPIVLRRDRNRRAAARHGARARGGLEEMRQETWEQEIWEKEIWAKAACRQAQPRSRLLKEALLSALGLRAASDPSCDKNIDPGFAGRDIILGGQTARCFTGIDQGGQGRGPIGGGFASPPSGRMANCTAGATSFSRRGTRAMRQSPCAGL